MATEEPEAEAHDESQPVRIRLIIDTEADLREAVRQRARKLSVQYRREVSNSEVLNEMIRTMFAEELAEIRNEPKPRRKRKPDDAGK